MSIQKLLAASVLRVKTVGLPGIGPIRIQEPSYGVMSEFREMSAQGKTREATAKLLTACILEDNGTALEISDAYKIVDGSLRVLNPLMTAITENLKEDAKNV